MNAEGRSRTTMSLLAVTLLAMSFALPASALAAKRVALIIGNAAYAEAPLRNPVNDARAMATKLEGFGFEVIRLENGTKTQMERALVKFASRLGEDVSGLFYYAGHGVQIRGRNYLVPVDARILSPQEARIESVGIDLVLNELAYAGNRLNIVILDACRNNPFERRLRGGSRGLAAIDAARGTLIAYSTAPGSVALDGDGRNGLYTEELLHALSEPGLKIEEVFKQVRVMVAKRTNELQIPWESSSLTGEFVFNPVSVDATPESVTARRNETLFWDSVQRMDTVGAYQVYLTQYPDGVFSTIAAIRISELKGTASAGAQAALDEQRPATVLSPSPEKMGKTDPKTEPAKQKRHHRKQIAITPLVGKSFSCTASDFDAGRVMRELSYKITEGGMMGTMFRYLGWDVDVEPGDLWQPVDLRKEPIPELVYEHGKRLEVDGMLLVWYEISGTVTCRTDYNVFLYDVVLETVYREEASDASLGSVTEALANRFLKERALAQGSGN
jgi:hypothetical protein